MGEITIAILKQHQIIDKNLADFDKLPEEDMHRRVNLFQIFQWNLNKHMFVEEENLFPLIDKADSNEIKQLQNLLKDHKDLKKIVDNISEEVFNERKPNTRILRELLGAHEKREVQSFYPLLDEQLPAERKKYVLKSLKDVKIV